MSLDIGGLSISVDATGMLNSAISSMNQGSTKYHLTSDASNAISGFYYDEQMKNEGLTMSLHPSMVPTGAHPEPDEFWRAADQREYGGIYDIHPIVKAIVSEDFQIAAANQWDDNTILDDATQLFNSVRGLAPYAQYFGDQADEIKQAGDESKVVNNDGSNGDNVAGWLNEGMGWLGKAARKVTPYLNRALVVQGSRFSYYNGTSIGFGNMTMKFTLFSDWVSGKPSSCIDKINGPAGEGCSSHGLIDYCIGKYVMWDKDAEPDKGLNQFVGWQIPPGGFKPDLKNVDNMQDGTLLLIIGDMYAIPNLVIQDAQFTFSKQVIKVPTSLDKIDLVPMYCDIQLTLKPASKYTGETFTKAIDGSLIENRKRDYIDKINNRLKALS